MKLVFTKLETSAKEIKVTFDGVTYKSYNVEELKKNSFIEFTESDCPDLTKIKIQCALKAISDINVSVAAPATSNVVIEKPSITIKEMNPENDSDKEGLTLYNYTVNGKTFSKLYYNNNLVNEDVQENEESKLEGNLNCMAIYDGTKTGYVDQPKVYWKVTFPPKEGDYVVAIDPNTLSETNADFSEIYHVNGRPAVKKVSEDSMKIMIDSSEREWFPLVGIR